MPGSTLVRFLKRGKTDAFLPSTREGRVDYFAPGSCHDRVLKPKAAVGPDPTGYGNEPNTVPGGTHSNGPGLISGPVGWNTDQPVPQRGDSGARRKTH